jgi:hypothetical protein
MHNRVLGTDLRFQVCTQFSLNAEISSSSLPGSIHSSIIICGHQKYNKIETQHLILG